MSGQERWLIYALGGGMGHVNRAAALARVALRDRVDRAAPPRITLLCNSPLADPQQLRRELPAAHLRLLESQMDRDDVSSRLDDTLAEQRFDRVIVDTFPRGLGGELAERLPQLDAVKILIHRDLNPRYVASYNLPDYVAEHYDLVLLPGEGGELGTAKQRRATAPWLIRDAEELLSREAARRCWGVEDTRPLIVVTGGGKPDEMREMQHLADQLRRRVGTRAHVRLESLAANGASGGGSQAGSVWPFFERIQGVDLLLGGGGYNTVYEARGGGVPLIAVARPRLYDRQARRLAADERVDTVDQATRQALRWLERAGRVERPAANFVNGAHSAVRRIHESRTAMRATI